MGKMEPGRKESPTAQDRIEKSIVFHFDLAWEFGIEGKRTPANLEIAIGHLVEAKGLLDALLTVKRFEA